MKQLLPFVAIAAMAAAVVSFVGTRWMAEHQAPLTVANLRDADWLQQKLGLDMNQATQLRQFEEEYRIKLTRCCERHCAARLELGETLAAAALDQKRALLCAERMGAAQAELEQVTLAHILRVRQLLTPAQQQQYTTLIRQQLAAACPMGAQIP